MSTKSIDSKVKTETRYIAIVKLMNALIENHGLQ